MNVERHQVASELAYDLLQDNIEVVLSLLEQPLPRDLVVERLGSEAVLDRMLRHGLILAEDNQICAVAEAYQQFRQEGMVSFLERYILPSLNASLANQAGTDIDGVATVWSRQLHLSRDAMQGLVSKNVDRLFTDLVDVSERPAQHTLSRMSVLIVGTSRMPETELASDDLILRQLQNASIQRATPEEREVAILSQFDCLADRGRYDATRKVVESFVGGVEAIEPSTDRVGNYHLTIATHWRCLGSTGVEGAVDVRQIC